MRPLSEILLAAAFATTLLGGPASAAALPASTGTDIQPAQPSISEQVRFRHYGNDGVGVAVGLSILGGAILGGALEDNYNDPYYDNTYYDNGPYYGGDAYCARRFRSYDAASGSYLGYDGRRHACP